MDIDSWRSILRRGGGAGGVCDTHKLTGQRGPQRRRSGDDRSLATARACGVRPLLRPLLRGSFNGPVFIAPLPRLPVVATTRDYRLASVRVGVGLGDSRTPCALRGRPRRSSQELRCNDADHVAGCVTVLADQGVELFRELFIRLELRVPLQLLLRFQQLCNLTFYSAEFI